MRILNACLVMLLVPHVAAAQLVEPQAVAQVKTSSKAELKQLKLAGTAARAVLEAQLEALEVQLPALDALQVLDAVSADVAAFVDVVNDAHAAAVSHVEEAAMEMLGGLGSSQELAGEYPKDLGYGTGGALDKHRAQALKAVTKLRDAARKRLAKFAQRAETEGGVALVILIELPTRELAASVNPFDLVKLGQTVTIDVVVSASDLVGSGWGYLYVGGSTSYGIMPVTVGWFRDFLLSDSTSVVPVDGRFAATFGPSLLEGGYSIWARHEDPVRHATASISLR